MAPTPQEPVSLREMPSNLDGDRVVISGVSGLFPRSHNVKHLEDILYNKKNPVTVEDCRWKFDHPEVNNYTGKVPGLGYFDAQFFKVHYRLAHTMDPMGRKVLEQAYQAIYDAGINSDELSGKKVGVYIGSCFSESEKAFFYMARTRTGFGIAGCSKSMFANRISYWLNAKGPSMAIDEACCSSLAALERAYQDISRGECEAAIVGGTNLSLHPQTSVHIARIMTVAPDGKTKSFDQNADGVAKSEAINVLFLQKAKDAKRIYAEILHIKSEFNEVVENKTGGPRYGFYRSPSNLANFFKKFYEEINILPEAVEYIEAFGSAVPEADKAELDAIEEVFCKNRSIPLLVGSVMSNIGYAEAASGISAITKVLLGYQKGQLAGNLHCETPRLDVPALNDGRMQIVRDHTSFSRSITAVNGISVTGVNAHVLLHGHYKPKDPNRYKSAISHLVTISGRQDTAVQKVLEDLKSRPIDPEELALFHNIHKTPITGHLGRGYTILSTNEEGKTVSLAETCSYFDGARRPLWFVYSGMGSQWAGMGTQLMKIPVFAAAIERCRKALEPKGIDIVHIITSTDKTIFDNILHSFIGIAAIQIGLTDVLTAMGIVPDKIIGHSVGELGCAYADGCFTAEEMILSAYSRGLVSVQTPFIKGSMAAVGIGYEQVVKLIPPEIEVACHNAAESSTISGPADIMKQFISELTEKGIFAKEVPCSNIAYHSRYIAEAGPGLLKYLSEVIKDPKPRSDRWVSTSVPQDKWDEPEAKFSSAYYHTNNLLSSVLFEETSRLIPSDAVLIEVAPHGLLQAILKRSLPETCKNIPLTRRGHSDNSFMVLDAIGKLYMEGYNPKIGALYPPIQFPVSTGTPMLSHLVEWAHNERWSIPLYVNARKQQSASCSFIVSVHDKESSYLSGHVLRGKNLYPYSAALVAAWDTLALSLNLQRKQISVQFRDLHLYSQPVLHDQMPLKFKVTLHRANGRFEILNDDRKLVTGNIRNELSETGRIFDMPFESKETLYLTADDVYQNFYEKDYFYREEFRSIHKVNKSLTEAEVVWNGNWVTFIDGLIQLNALSIKHDTVSQPFQIRRLCIDIQRHNRLEALERDDKKVLPVQVFNFLNITRCGGVIIENIQYRNLPPEPVEPASLKCVKFVPRFKANIDLSNALQVYLQIVAENISTDTINILGITNNNEELAVFNEIKNVINDVPGVNVKYEQIGRDKVLVMMRDSFLTEVDVLLVKDLSSDDSLCQLLYRVLRRDTFLVNVEGTSEDCIRPSALYRVISAQNTINIKLDLVKWRPTQLNAASTVATVRSASEISLLKQTRNDLPQRHKLVILSTYPAVPGLKDLVTSWRKELDKNQIYLVMVSDSDNLDQLSELDLAFSVLVNGVWGGEYITSTKDHAKVDRGVTLRSARVGDLDSLNWVEAGDPVGPGIPVTVHYAGINDIDVKKAAGIIPYKDDTETSYCMDFSGVSDSGERVMGIIERGAASSRIRARPELTWPVPAHWSLEDAVTVPLAYAHAYYIFSKKVQFMRRYKILVHGAAGALGQAVIAVALAHDCEVFATVSDVKKKRFLMKLFPKLKEDHICNSRDTVFTDIVRNVTEGKGCNVVISCLKSEFKIACLNCLAPCGIMVDTAQLPTQEDYDFGMYYLTQERNYVSIDFSSVFANGTSEMKELQTLVSEGIARGHVVPLSRATYSPMEVGRAFRLQAASRHRGRLLLRLQDKVVVAEPRISCSPDLCHVVISDDQTFGVQLAERLSKRGAKKLYLYFTNLNHNLCLKVQSWESRGVKVQMSSGDISNNKNVVALLSDSNRLGPVEGIYVMVTDVKASNVDKLTGMVANLDLAARKLCPSVRYFAIISAGLSIGQKTCLSRTRDGLPATNLNLPSLLKVNDTNSKSNIAISWRSALDVTEKALRSTDTVLEAHPKSEDKSTLLQHIAAIAGIKLPTESLDTLTLLELGLETAKVPAVSSFLADNYNIALNEETIPNLTIQSVVFACMKKGVAPGFSWTFVEAGPQIEFVHEVETCDPEPCFTYLFAYGSLDSYLCGLTLGCLELAVRPKHYYSSVSVVFACMKKGVAPGFSWTFVEAGPQIEFVHEVETCDPEPCFTYLFAYGSLDSYLCGLTLGCLELAVRPKHYYSSVRIKEIEESFEGHVFKKLHGLNVFYPYVDPDEIISATDLVFLSTLTHTNTMIDDSFDVTHTYLCVIPGLEGHHHRFKTLCERLKMPAIVLQPGLDHLDETIKETAEKYAKTLLTKACLQKEFYLLGFESGVLIALEVASILESHGLTGTVFCVGGAPEEIQTAIKEELSEYETDDALQNAVVRHMYRLMCDSEELDVTLENISLWRLKIDACVRSLLGKVSHSAQYARYLMVLAYSRIKQALAYKIEPQELRSKIVLLHAAGMQSSRSPRALIQRYSQQEVTVYQLEMPLCYAVDDARCTSIVNDHLNSEILKAFEEKNICDTYLLNVFMTDALGQNDDIYI